MSIMQLLIAPSSFIKISMVHYTHNAIVQCNIIHIHKYGLFAYNSSSWHIMLVLIFSCERLCHQLKSTCQLKCQGLFIAADNNREEFSSKFSPRKVEKSRKSPETCGGRSFMIVEGRDCFSK